MMTRLDMAYYHSRSLGILGALGLRTCWGILYGQKLDRNINLIHYEYYYYYYYHSRLLFISIVSDSTT
jgi:hypothetical protein